MALESFDQFIAIFFYISVIAVNTAKAMELVFRIVDVVSSAYKEKFTIRRKDGY